MRRQEEAVGGRIFRREEEEEEEVDGRQSASFEVTLTVSTRRARLLSVYVRWSEAQDRCGEGLMTAE